MKPNGIARLANVMATCVLLVIAGAKQPVKAETFNALEDAVLSQVKRWQSGGRAKPLMSSDGKVIFPFSQGMPKLTCSPTRVCDIEMEPGETPKKVALGDAKSWDWQAAESIENGKTIKHVIIQPKDVDIETNLIVYTDKRTYHIKLHSPKSEGVYLNRIGFYYPESLVTAWEDKAGKAAETAAKDQASNVMPRYTSPTKMAFDYRIEGNADFRPIRVFNDGERVYMAMPAGIRHTEYPTLALVDEKGELMVVNYRRSLDTETSEIHYVIDKLFNKAELHRGNEKVVISWKRSEKSAWDRIWGAADGR